jgi:hypothetical protein
MDEGQIEPRTVRQASVLASRAGRRAIEPISSKLADWHSRTAFFAARLNRMLLRGELTGDILPEIEALASQVESELSYWRSTVEGPDATGRVDDAEQASRTILAKLADLRQRAYDGLL